MDGQTAQGESAYHKITASEAKAMMNQGGVTVVDVRREDEYAAGHIPGSILVPNEGIRDTQPEELPDLDAVLLVHCRTGVRSKQASDKLLEIGYKNVYDFGGIVDWPYETVAED
nr:rhodanese-like domain-containing protein [uncultured Lachnoclostridium sp.]